MSTKISAWRAISRRTFLTLGGLGLGSWLTACNDTSTQTYQPPAPTATPTSQPKPAVHATSQPALTETAWMEFAHNLHGTLVRPGDAHYATAHQLFNTRFDTILPAGIAYCASLADVQASLAFARSFHLPITARSGGHSYAGYSSTTGLVLDVTQLNQVTVDTNAGTATIGGGARLIDVYAALAPYGVVIPAGSCPTVGIAGLTLGGGIGVLGRKFGLTCDNLLSAQVVLANGEILTCNQQSHADLFWALRGGGGGNLGVVTSFTFRVHPVTELTLFTLNWPWQKAAAVVNAWQKWGPQATDELWSNCLLLGTTTKNTDPLVRVNGVYVGEAGPLNTLLQQLSEQVGIAPSSSYVYTDSLLETMMVEAGCYGETVAACHLPSQNPQGKLARDTSQARSDYVSEPLSAQAINNLVNSISQRQASSILSSGGIGMDAHGGAINRVAANATAFIHRNSLFSIQYTASWNAHDSASVVAANQAWLNATWQAMRPSVNGEAYQNYIDPDLSNWQQAYYGANLPRLQQVKAAYDPTNIFHFAQSIGLG